MQTAAVRDVGGQRAGGSGELRQGNLTQILRHLRDHGPSSRHDIARGCGLGVSTMTDLVADLRARRLVVELEPIRRPGAGRPTRPIALDGSPWCVLGIHVDVDRVHVVAATVGGRELWQETVWYDLHDAGVEVGASMLSELLRGQVERIPEGIRLVALEVGIPGLVARERGVVLRSTGLGWCDVDLGELVSNTLVALGVDGVHVGVANDSHLAGLLAARSELEQSGQSVAAYLGGVRDVGSALIVGGEIYRGTGGGGGDLGHVHVEDAGQECWCGRRGCLNAEVRAEHLLVRAELVDAEEAVRLVHEQPRKAIAILTEAAQVGNPRAIETLSRAGDALGRAIDDIIGVINPHAVLLGGYLGRLGPFLMPTIEAQLSHRLEVSPYASTQVIALDEGAPRVAAGAVLAARDACLYDPLGLTEPVPVD